MSIVLYIKFLLQMLFEILLTIWHPSLQYPHVWHRVRPISRSSFPVVVPFGASPFVKHSQTYSDMPFQPVYPVWPHLNSLSLQFYFHLCIINNKIQCQTDPPPILMSSPTVLTKKEFAYRSHKKSIINSVVLSRFLSRSLPLFTTALSDLSH